MVDAVPTPVPTPSRREEYAEATRLALLEAAREVFVQEGFQAAGIEAISRRARVTRGAFYHHFADKRVLFEALVVALQADAARRVSARAVREKDLMAQVRAGTEEFLRVCVEPGYRRLVIQEAPAVLGSARCREIGETYPFGLMIGALTRLKADGVVDVEDPRLAGRMLGSMICEASLLLEDAKRPRVLERQALALFDRALESLRTR